MQLDRYQLIQEPELCLSAGPLFVTRRGRTTLVYNGGFNRWKAVKIATVQVWWKWKWQVSFHGEVLGHRISGSIASERPTFLRFKGMIGEMLIGDVGKADVRVSELEVSLKSYRIQIAGKRNAWEALLVAQRTRDHDVQVEVSCNDKRVISSPSRYETWAEGLWSIGGFVRLKWGDWLMQGRDVVPTPAIVACLCCVALHNNVLGDLLLSDPPAG